MFTIRFTTQAQTELLWFSKRDQKVIIQGIRVSLSYEPTIEAKNRKPMQANPYASQELRVQKFRVLYNVDTEVEIVSIEKIGLKINNKFFFKGKDTPL